MILCLAGVLGADDLRRVTGHLAGSRFVSGRRTAGWHARGVKKNRQLAPAASRAAAALVVAALGRHEVFQSAVRPRRLAPILFNRYEPGMEYGTHVDDPIMRDPDGQPLRSDVSLTLFLSDPASYEGGALVIDDTGGERAFRLAAGDMVVYPATTLHRVEPVRSGVRLAAVGWAQSLVPDPGQREILFDLDVARRGLFASHGKTHEFDLLTKSHANLLRRWAAV
jgi:PKHD-type hydroxylase